MRFFFTPENCQSVFFTENSLINFVIMLIVAAFSSTILVNGIIL